MLKFPPSVYSIYCLTHRATASRRGFYPDTLDWREIAVIGRISWGSLVVVPPEGLWSGIWRVKPPDGRSWKLSAEWETMFLYFLGGIVEIQHLDFMLTVPARNVHEFPNFSHFQ